MKYYIKSRLTYRKVIERMIKLLPGSSYNESMGIFSYDGSNFVYHHTIVQGDNHIICIDIQHKSFARVISFHTVGPVIAQKDINLDHGTYYSDHNFEYNRVDGEKY